MAYNSIIDEHPNTLSRGVWCLGPVAVRRASLAPRFFTQNAARGIRITQRMVFVVVGIPSHVDYSFKTLTKTEVDR